MACVSGEAGIGKTTLVESLAAESVKAGHRVLRGAATIVWHEPVALAPITQALRELGNPGGYRSATGRAEMFELTLERVTADPTAGRTQILILEDLHWADASTVELVAFLARNLPAGHLILLTFRDDQDFVDAGARYVLGALMADRRVVRLLLGRLDDEELAQLAESTLGRPLDANEKASLVRRSSGNPFIAQELLDAGRLGELPTTLADVLLSRADRLTPEARAAMHAVAVLGRPGEPVLIQSMTGVGPERTIKALAECVAAGMLTVDAERSRYAFRHALLEEAALARILPAEAARLHLRAALALSTDVESTSNNSLVAEWATHWYASGHRDQALDAALLAAQAAEAVFAYEETWRQLSRAIELRQRGATGQVETSPYELFSRAAQAAQRAGQLGRAIELTRRTLTLAASSEDRAEVNQRLARMLWESNDKPAAELALIEAAADVGTSISVAGARVAASGARFAMQTGRYDDAFDLASLAIRVAEATGTRPEIGQALTTLGMAEAVRGDLEAGIAHIRAGRDLIERFGDADNLRWATSNLAVALVSAGRTAEAAETARAGLARARRYSAVSGLGSGAVGNTIVMLRFAGRWEEGDRLAADLLLNGVTAGQSICIHLAQAQLAIARGRFATAETELGSARALLADGTPPPSVVDLRLAEAELAANRDEVADARQRIRQALSALTGYDEPRELARVAASGLRITADCVRRPGRRPVTGTATLEHELLRVARAARKAMPTPDVLAYAGTAEAEFARGQGHDRAELWRQAVEGWDRVGRPYEISWAQFRLAETLAANDRAAATACLASAARCARELSALPLLERVESLARRARINLEPSGAPEPSGPGPLTRREGEILRELATGRTNKEIARRLFLSPRTVDVHVSNVLAKLGASNRTEAVSLATRQGLLGSK